MATRACLSFEESLMVPGVGFPAWAAYGVKMPPDCTSCSDYCDRPWSVAARQQWIAALSAAQSQIEKRLKRPLCPTVICNEIHPVGCPIKLRHFPILYLGREKCTFLYTATVEYWTRQENLPCSLSDSELSSCPICAGCADQHVAAITVPKEWLPSGASADDIGFSYGGGDCPPKTNMVPPKPCVIERDDEFVFIWNKHSLFSPLAEPDAIDSTDCFVRCLDISICTIDDTDAIAAVGECDCGCRKVCRCIDECKCGGKSGSGFEYEVADHDLGIICVKPTGNNCTTKYVKITYTTAQSCDGLGDDMAEAIVKLALTKLAPESQVCSCDRFTQIVKHWNETDPSAAQAFAKDIWFGSQAGAMTAQRIVAASLTQVTAGRFAYGGFLSTRRGS